MIGYSLLKNHTFIFSALLLKLEQLPFEALIFLVEASEILQLAFKGKLVSLLNESRLPSKVILMDLIFWISSESRMLALSRSLLTYSTSCSLLMKFSIWLSYSLMTSSNLSDDS